MLVFATSCNDSGYIEIKSNPNATIYYFDTLLQSSLLDTFSEIPADRKPCDILFRQLADSSSDAYLIAYHKNGYLYARMNGRFIKLNQSEGNVNIDKDIIAFYNEKDVGIGIDVKKHFKDSNIYRGELTIIVRDKQEKVLIEGSVGCK